MEQERRRSSFLPLQFDMRKDVETMKRYSIPFPNAYSKDNSRYTFIDPTTGMFYEYIAGQDGIDERWIEIIKKEDRGMNADGRRFQRWRKKDGTNSYARTLISMEEFPVNYFESGDALCEANLDAEQMIIMRTDALAFIQAYKQALSRLTEGTRAVWLLYAEHGFSINDIARYLNLPYGTAKKRIQRAKKILQKILQKFCPQSGLKLTDK